MTPELKKACELVFQEHKIATGPISWTKDSFRGRLSFGMAALAKETLERRNIICPRNPAKKTFTILNPMATGASNFEEAEEMIQNKTPVIVLNKEAVEREYTTHRIPAVKNSDADIKSSLLEAHNKPVTKFRQTRSWVKPLLWYFVFPICAAIAGGLITYLLGLLIYLF
jgi:hypothetical protein